MILCDFNMIAISNLMSYMTNNPQTKVDFDLVRHTTLNALRSFNMQFRSRYGEMVLCCDSRTYWRKEIFPYYKAGRKKTRAKSSHDWKFIFAALSSLRQEFSENMPWRVIEVDGAEGDDVIATLTKLFHKDENILILSSDKDFVQLQKYANVTQYNPTMKRFVNCPDPKAFTKEHIIRGDFNDGIPNILSPSSTLVDGVRQKSINTKKLSDWMVQSPAVFCTTVEMWEGYERNQRLIDLDYIPQAIQDRIAEQFKQTLVPSRTEMINYFEKHKLTSLLQVIAEF